MCSTFSLKYFERYHKLISKLQHYVQARPYHFNADSVNTNVTSIQNLDSLSNVLLLILNSVILCGILRRDTMMRNFQIKQELTF